ncbi:MAG: YjcQ family protein [Anaerovoracaceae bacterium]
MENFKAVYKLLSALERAMDLPEFDVIQEVNHENLKVSKERYARYIEMMLDVGYIKGAIVKKNINGDTIIDGDNIRITLKGLEYLQENSMMRQIYNTAKGIKETIPFV